MSSDFDILRQFLLRASGLALDAEKTYLAESRLQPVIQRNGLRDLAELVRCLSIGADKTLQREVVEAMATNETFFFRDRAAFDDFHKVMLPKLIAARQTQRRIRIWCAASSTGQEAYSLAMILDEEFVKLHGWLVEIVATDVSHAVLDLAREGSYSQFEVQRGLPISHLLRHFQREGERWRINEHLRSRVRFEPFNLLSSFNELGRFDVIFCRNVLIYFDIANKRSVLTRMADVLAPDGYLVLGSAETVVGLTDAFMPHPEYRSFSVHRPEHLRAAQPLRLVATS